MIDYRILGPLEVSTDGRPIEIGGPRLRALLVILLLRANEAVPRDVLAHELWGERPPDGAQHTIDVYVSRLRKALDSAADEPVVVTRPGAYSLRLADGQLDVSLFERFVEEGKSALAGNVPDQAAEKFRAALKLWRGPALVDLVNGSGPHIEAARLEERRLGAVEDRVEADLALGRHEDVVGELQALVASYPLRERLHRLLMIALYRSGRQAEALEAYQAARRTLVEDLGLEPSPALRELQCAILRQDVSLDPPGIGSDRKKWLLAIAVALAVTLVSVVAATTHEPARLLAGPNTIGVIDGASGNLSAVVADVGRPNGVAYGAGAVWITDSADDLLLRADSAGQVIDRIPVGHGPAGVTVGDGQVWVANELDGTVSEVNPGAGQQVATVRVGIGPDAIGFGYGSVWVANVTDDTLSRIDAATSEVVATIPVSGAPTGLAVGDGSVWLTSRDTGELLGIDPADNRPSRAVTIAGSPDGVAVGGGGVWVADAGGAVSRFDPRTGRLHTIRVGGAPTGVAYSAGAVWVADSLSGTVSRIDPETNATRLVQVGNEPTDLAAAGNDVWATVLPSLASHRGGTLTLIGQELPSDHPFFPTDPAVAFDTLPWQMLSLTNDGLVGYRRVGGLAGDELVPDLATALPVPTGGGLDYTFRLRAGLAYSTGVPVRPEDFRRALERVFVIGERENSSIPSVYAGIVGASQCERRPGPCGLAGGIVADDAADTVTFRLTAPDPEFLYKLAFPWADAVPDGTPDHVIGAAQLPATGPYMTQSLVPRHTWILIRNPRFREWSPQAQPGGYPDRIVLRLDIGPGQSVSDVEHGQADVLLSPPPGSISQLETRYTSQLHIGPLTATIALTLNTRVAPFDNQSVRQAVNDALDRNAAIALNGGPLAAQPTCQILPPTMVGYRPYCPYTIQPGPGGAWTEPNLALAEQLVRASGTRGDKVTVLYGNQDAPFPSQATARYVVSVLDQLGYRASLRVVSSQAYWPLLGDSRDQVQAGFFVWYQDYPAPADFIDPLLSCGSFLPGNPNNINTAEFCDPRIDAQAGQALTLEAASPPAAASRWAAIDRALVDEAPWVSLYSPRDLTLLSARVGNYQFHPYWDLLIDQLWVR